MTWVSWVWLGVVGGVLEVVGADTYCGIVVSLKVFRTDLEEFGDGLVVVLNGLKVVGGSFPEV